MSFSPSHPIPIDKGGDGYGYDLAINPKKNVLLTSSFTGWNNYMTNIGKLIKDAEAMKHFGNTMVLWNLEIHATGENLQRSRRASSKSAGR